MSVIDTRLNNGRSVNEIDRDIARIRKREAEADARAEAKRAALAQAKENRALNALWPQVDAEIPQALARLKGKGYPGATSVDVRDGFMGRKVSRAAWEIGSFSYSFSLEETMTGHYYLTSSGHLVRGDTWGYGGYSGGGKPMTRHQSSPGSQLLGEFLQAIRRLGT